MTSIKPDDLVQLVVKWGAYISDSHCGYCDGKSASAQTTQRKHSTLYSMNIANTPILRKLGLNSYMDEPPNYDTQLTEEDDSFYISQITPSTAIEVRPLPIDVYAELMNRGFRRSGHILYKIDQKNSCCPQYTMRLNVSDFKPSKDHRKALNRFNRFVSGESETNLLSLESEAWAQKKKDLLMTEEGNKLQKQVSNPKKKKTKSFNKPVEDAYNLEFHVHKVDADYQHTKKDTIPLDHHFGCIPSDISFRTVAGETLEQIKNKDTQKKFYKHIQTCRPEFKVSLRLARATKEKFDLYRRYQVAIHKDEYDDVTITSFNRFLCASPLNYNEEWANVDNDKRSGSRNSVTSDSDEAVFAESDVSEETELSIEQVQKLGGGTFHHEYRYMGKLLAFGVLDILPGQCVSSVYLVWDPDYKELELGKVSALREIVLAKSLGIKYYYLGLYVPSCSKMLYKASFKPTELLDPMAPLPLKPASSLSDRSSDGKKRSRAIKVGDENWFPLEEYEKLWDKDGTHTDWYVSILEHRNKQERKETETPQNQQEVNFVRETLGPFPLIRIKKTKLFKIGMPGIISFEDIANALKVDYNIWKRSKLCIRMAQVIDDEDAGIYDDDDDYGYASGQMNIQNKVDYYHEASLGFFFKNGNPYPKLIEYGLEFAAAVGLDLAPYFTQLIYR